MDIILIYAWLKVNPSQYKGLQVTIANMVMKYNQEFPYVRKVHDGISGECMEIYNFKEYLNSKYA